MKRAIQCLFFIGLGVLHPMAFAESSSEKFNKYKVEPLVVPYERPIGFTLNLAGALSATAEGRFILGLVRNLSLVVAPMYQNTPELPIWKIGESSPDFFDMRRANLGLGVRTHFYEYDSWDGWYIEALGRGGMTWIGKDPWVWSVIPSLMAGYAVVYDSGYTFSIGAGFEYEFLIPRSGSLGSDATYLKEAYYTITKLPLTAEISIGWMW